jgi:peptide subunit release factor RF-3
VVLNPNQKLFGDKLISIKYPASALSIKWTAQVPTFSVVLEQIKDRLGANAIPVQIPHRLRRKFQGVVDLIQNKAFVWEEQSTELFSWKYLFLMILS